MKDHLFLLGFMGSGKSRWGAQLAAPFGLAFLDLDREIVKGERQTIAEIFAGQGEAGFRTLERKYLHALAEQPASVVALGGGTPCFFDNMDWINRQGRSIYLQVPLETLIDRLQRKAGQRPLLAQWPVEEWPQRLGKILEDRAPFYEQAQHIVEYDGDDSSFFSRLCAAAF
ncbi:MAG: shikimate kinase [Saprospiraceae bacterium]